MKSEKQLENEYMDAYEAFIERHAGDVELLKEVNVLLDLLTHWLLEPAK